jgi:predicted signal transduction protein with EAL and GGDEF domain
LPDFPEKHRQFQDCWQELRPSDIAGRRSGDESVGVLPHCNTATATDTVERLLALLGQSRTIAGTSVVIATSAGVAMYPHDGLELKTLVHRADLESDEAARTLSAAILSIGKSRHLTVVAEGVETESQRFLLREQGYPVAQGYLFARPMPAPAFEHWFQQLNHRADLPSEVVGHALPDAAEIAAAAQALTDARHAGD